MSEKYYVKCISCETIYAGVIDLVEGELKFVGCCPHCEEES